MPLRNATPRSVRRFGSAIPLVQKICSTRVLARHVRQLQQRGGRVVFTNGCFDLLHVGHVTLLQRARRLGDALIVAINSDRSVRRLKGTGRPIVRQRDRAKLVAALSSVDYVTIFDDPTPLRLITVLKPDVLVKGADWKLAGIIGQGLVTKYGGRVVRVPLVSGYSTTRLITHVRRVARPPLR